MKYPLLSRDHPLNRKNGTDGTALIVNYQGRRRENPLRPVWFMRQAGRSLPEYHRIRAGTNILEACLNPELAAEITLQPVRRHHVDAAIFFSDIMIPAKIAGLGVEIVPGTGPVIDKPIRNAADVAKLPDPGSVFTSEAFRPVTEAIHRINDELIRPGHEAIPLIGFAGAPFTVAAYLVEGKPSRDHLAARSLMISDPKTWRALMQWVTDSSIEFLQVQAAAGASAIQLFDSWAGSLSQETYAEYVAPFSTQIFDALKRLGIPKVHYGAPNQIFLTAVKESGADVIGINEQVPLAYAANLLGNGIPLQGNIDPAVLQAPWRTVEKHVRAVAAAGEELPGHVVNLGHGVPPAADPDVLTRIVELVHTL